ncbi:hypothetical protein JR316_0010395 [Psilocybe cubensis]|uniref:Uncharacterized protein n=2 Tax=Psilocybe cubensis TaxID=181762 RepID=A0ACB8GLH4_PSICU|nr:hypothetical protein JR316_0010395 [Psilocybe cubensis]KAH9476483.1 hypothetical protein JR316_0010395 [Psilocybe cubensis]
MQNFRAFLPNVALILALLSSISSASPLAGTNAGSLSPRAPITPGVGKDDSLISEWEDQSSSPGQAEDGSTTDSILERSGTFYPQVWVVNHKI